MSNSKATSEGRKEGDEEVLDKDAGGLMGSAVGLNHENDIEREAESLDTIAIANLEASCNLDANLLGAKQWRWSRKKTNKARERLENDPVVAELSKRQLVKVFVLEDMTDVCRSEETNRRKQIDLLSPEVVLETQHCLEP